MLIERIAGLIKNAFNTTIAATHHGRNFTATWLHSGKMCKITFSRQPLSNKLIATVNGKPVTTQLVEKNFTGHMNTAYFEDAILECIKAVKKEVK